MFLSRFVVRAFGWVVVVAFFSIFVIPVKYNSRCVCSIWSVITGIVAKLINKSTQTIKHCCRWCRSFVVIVVGGGGNHSFFLARARQNKVDDWEWQMISWFDSHLSEYVLTFLLPILPLCRSFQRLSSAVLRIFFLSIIFCLCWYSLFAIVFPPFGLMFLPLDIIYGCPLLMLMHMSICVIV